MTKVDTKCPSIFKYHYISVSLFISLKGSMRYQAIFDRKVHFIFSCKTTFGNCQHKCCSLYTLKIACVATKMYKNLKDMIPSMQCAAIVLSKFYNCKFGLEPEINTCPKYVFENIINV